MVSFILTYIGDKFLQLQLTCMLSSLSSILASNASTPSVRARSGSSLRHVRQAYCENSQVIDSSLMVRVSTAEEVGCSDDAQSQYLRVVELFLRSDYGSGGLAREWLCRSSIFTGR
jgi:hypothetical protein